MQAAGTNFDSTETFFDQIKFDYVYHDGPYGSSEAREIPRCRCAEVLAASPLKLNGMLQAVLCRSAAERATLLHYLGSAAATWGQRVIAYTEPGLFEGRYTYVETVDVTEEGIRFKLHPRYDGGKVETKVELLDSQGRSILVTNNNLLDPSTRYIIKKPLSAGRYLVRIDLEGCRAYEAESLIDDLPF
jgi:hypothetical protein